MRQAWDMAPSVITWQVAISVTDFLAHEFCSVVVGTNVHASQACLLNYRIVKDHKEYREGLITIWLELFILIYLLINLY